MYKTRISGTGSYLPERLLTNKDLEKLVETNDAWIVERTGIRTRHIAAPDQATSDLGLIASQRALEAAGLTARDIDMIIFCTIYPDQPAPNTGCVLQQKLGCRPIMAFDLNAACTGFVYGITVADQFIKSGFYKHILVVGAEVLSRIMNYTDRETCILFGDAAGAVIVSRNETTEPSEIKAAVLTGEGNLGHLFEIPAGGSKITLTHEVLDQKLHTARMKGKEIFKHAVRTMTTCCTEVLKKSEMTKDEVDWLVPHQANLRILESVAKYFDIPLEKVVINLQHTGNTSAATVPVALDEAIRDGRIQRGQNVLLTAFGAGLTAGSVMLRY